ncbi:MAG: DNA recombination protein RmuC [Kiritimatiellae bacterium]|nr:DNA recombination protein RmuC [Kiritimatiellia bacterium]
MSGIEPWILLTIVLVLAALAALLVILDARSRREHARLRENNIRLETELAYQRQTGEDKLRLLQNAEDRLKTEFENIAGRIVEDKGRLLTDQNRARLSDLLQPFKEQMDAFRRRVDEVHTSELKQTERLMEQVRQLQNMSNRVSDEANNLARAIKGDAKQQGNWGELIVERIFESSGLEPGRDYARQESLRGEDGGLRKPDFMVHLPGSKAVIVDSKVSLTAYERYCAAEDESERRKELGRHVQSVRNHVEELRDKGYADLLGNRSLDFVLMCIPLEPAYHAAMQGDPDLLYDLARTKVVITGPTTLMITLKLIAQIWRREHENRNAEVIAERAGKLYDQVALVLEAVTDARKRLGGAGDAMDLALNRIAAGRGNLVGRVEEIRKLGAKVSRVLPDAARDTAALTDEIGKGHGPISDSES